MTVTVFRQASAILGESLVLDAAERTLYWCDITSGLIHASPLEGGATGDRAAALPAPVASFHLATIGGEPGFVVSLGDRVVLADRDGQIVRELARIEHAHAGLRLNEGKVDPAGRWVTGSMDLTTGQPDGAYYSVTPDGELRVLRGGLGVANGLEWSLDGSRVYFTDTSVGTIYTGDYSADGDITDVEVFHHGEPHDGLAIDAEGCLWGALYGEGAVVRYDAGGTELARFELPAPNLTSVAFGPGENAPLYVASARENLTEEDLQRHPLSGSVFALDTATSGRAARVFIAE